MCAWFWSMEEVVADRCRSAKVAGDRLGGWVVA